jgi:hypothetical protein
LRAFSITGDSMKTDAQFWTRNRRHCEGLNGSQAITGA